MDLLACKLVMGECDWHIQGPEINPEHCKTTARTTKQKSKEDYGYPWEIQEICRYEEKVLVCV